MAENDDPCLPPFDSGDPRVARALLDRLLTNSKFYKNSKDYKELLDFVARLRKFAPFNAMLLKVQKPGIRFAASARDWRVRFKRTPKEDARPLLIMWPFGPVALVYDEVDTEGDPLPEDVRLFPARGPITNEEMASFESRSKRKNILWQPVDHGDANAGSIRMICPARDKQPAVYRIHINRNHATATQFTTVAHELGHLFLGHLGTDKKLNIPKRIALTQSQQEFEAESVAYLVCHRNGVTSKSHTYLSGYVNHNSTLDRFDLSHIMLAAGKVEALLGLNVQRQLF
ncbi:MAG: ImmA/IrrE family metallo-endopeptidase [Pyrinomonadaceae bacterium]